MRNFFSQYFLGLETCNFEKKKSQKDLKTTYSVLNITKKFGIPVAYFPVIIFPGSSAFSKRCRAVLPQNQNLKTFALDARFTNPVSIIRRGLELSSPDDPENQRTKDIFYF